MTVAAFGHLALLVSIFVLLPTVVKISRPVLHDHGAKIPPTDWELWAGREKLTYSRSATLAAVRGRGWVLPPLVRPATPKAANVVHGDRDGQHVYAYQVLDPDLVAGSRGQLTTVVGVTLPADLRGKVNPALDALLIRVAHLTNGQWPAELHPDDDTLSAALVAAANGPAFFTDWAPTATSLIAWAPEELSPAHITDIWTLLTLALARTLAPV